MKKLLIMAVAVLMSTAASAQIVRSHSSSVTKVRKPSVTHWYVRAGVGADFLVGSDDYSGYSRGSSVDGPVIGANVGAGFQRVAESGFYWGAELGLATHGAKIQDEIWRYNSDAGYDEYIGDEYNSYRSLGVYLMPQVGWRVKVGNNLYLDPHIGPYISYDFAVLSDTADGLGHDWREPDIGAAVGVGLWINNINIDVQARPGFATIKSEGRTFKVFGSIGYQF